jgi:hypothetical protein
LLLKPDTPALRWLCSPLAAYCTSVGAIQAITVGYGISLLGAQSVRDTFAPRLVLCRIFSIVTSLIAADEKVRLHYFEVFHFDSRFRLTRLIMFLQVNDSKTFAL